MKIVLTGGTGCGKTTVIRELEKMGFPVMNECARELAVEEEKKGSEFLPWKDWQGFQIILMEAQLKKEAGIKALTFLDRGIIDQLPFFWLHEVRPPEVLLDACSRAGYKMIFALEMVSDYKKDPIRKEDLETAKKLVMLTERAYKQFGYSPIKVPVMPPADRAKFILEKAGLTRS